MLHPYLDTLPEAQRALWPMLRPTPALGFVLYGGTAIALRLGHRTSVDFDFFSDRPLIRDTMDHTLSFLRNATLIQDEPNALSILVQNHPATAQPVKVSFFGTITFGRVGTPDYTDDGMLQIASLDDLMATKLKVMLQRIEAKDYRDVAAMLQAGASLAKGLAAARALYGVSFQPSESLKALVYFNGSDLHTLRHEEKYTLVNAVKSVGDLPTLHMYAQELALSPPSLQ